MYILWIQVSVPVLNWIDRLRIEVTDELERLIEIESNFETFDVYAATKIVKDLKICWTQLNTFRFKMLLEE